MYLGRGVNRATKAWGAALLRKYGTVRAEDFTTQWLGFSTDNVSEREPLSLNAALRACAAGQRTLVCVGPAGMPEAELLCDLDWLVY